MPVSGLFIYLSGHVVVSIDRGAGRSKLMEWRGAADVGGTPAVSRTGHAARRFHRAGADGAPYDSARRPPGVIRNCHEVTSVLVHRMLDRSRVFLSSGLQDEKMLSLGKLSAGVAHELNNPVSAIARNAALLGERLDDAERAARAVSMAGLTDAQLAAIDELRASCAVCTSASGGGSAYDPSTLTPIQRVRREARLKTGWLITASTPILRDRWPRPR